eukprot:TRINITY_DN107693_c0_g1_i1.p1 TRINITY_DN107693_c0_g1~~TRINITY_DN107693_c0_g1_i1.p1  ORF type:complete len:1011 (-),score=173.95 TRINITY_DN107693_c0_g1_i1:50-3082(-)
MRSVSPKVWELIPGYDSEGEDEGGDDDAANDSSADDEGETAGSGDEGSRPAPTTEEILRVVVRALGDRWVDAPFVELTPVQPGTKFASLAKLMSTAAAVAAAASGHRPPGFRIDRIHAPLVRDTFLHNNFRPTRGEDWLVSWSGPRMRDNIHKMMHEFQRINHFPASTELTRKDRLWENLDRMAKTMGNEDFDFIPETFVLPNQMRAFKQRFLKNKGEHLWIVKPAASSQGKGIFILRNLIDLPMKAAVVSRYVENPLLIQGLKFDLRIYVLVTSFDPLRAFIYREGLTRFASKQYSTDDEHLSDVFRHLTNYSINKSAQNFQENQRVQADNYGHKWSLSALNRHLKCVGVDVDVMWTGIMDLITKTLLSVEPVICKATRDACIHEQSCFELYGFDVLVDENLKSWLLEVNLSPSMQADSPLDRTIKSSLISDAFNLLGLRKVDAQMVTTARLRSRLTYLTKLQNSVNSVASKRRASDITCRQDPIRRNQDDAEASIAAAVLHATAESTQSVTEEGQQQRPESVASASKPRSEAPGTKKRERFSTSSPVSLDGLPENSLKMLAHALEEFLLCNNFIRLYPTPSTVQRYSFITEQRGPSEDLRAQLLHSVLFGRHLPTFSGRGNQFKTAAAPQEFNLPEPSPHESDEEETTIGEYGEDDGEAEQELDVGIKGMSFNSMHNMKLVEEALQTLKVLGSKMGPQLLLMEYLIRIINSCCKLTTVVRKKIQAREQGSVALILQAFRQQLALYLRTKGGGSKRVVAATDVGEGDVVDQLARVSQQTLVVTLNSAWSAGQEIPSDIYEGADEFCLADCAPAAFAQSASGCRAISALAGLSSTDLEYILKGPQCPLEFRNLLALPDPTEDDEDALRQRFRVCSGASVGPLSEMEFLLKVNAPRPVPLRQPPGPRDELPPLAPRLARQGLASSAPQLPKRGGRPGSLTPLEPKSASTFATSSALGRGPLHQLNGYAKALASLHGSNALGILAGKGKLGYGGGAGYRVGSGSQLTADIEL